MPEPTHVESDLYCIRCGHNLRTLAWAAKCGECGAHVTSSRVPSHLNIQDLRVLHGIRMGIALLVVWIITRHFMQIIDLDSMVEISVRRGVSFGMLFWLNDWIPTLIRTAALALLVRAAIRIERRRYFLILAVVPVILEILVKLLLWTTPHFPGDVSDELWKALRFLIPMASAGYIMPLLFIFLWFHSLFNFPERSIGWLLLKLGTVLAGCLVVVTGLRSACALDWWLTFQGVSYLEAFDVTLALIGLILIVLRRRIPGSLHKPSSQ